MEVKAADAGGEEGEAKDGSEQDETPTATRTRKRKYRLSTAVDEDNAGAQDSDGETATPSKVKRRAVSTGDKEIKVEKTPAGTPEKRVTRSVDKDAERAQQQEQKPPKAKGWLSSLFGRRK